MAESLDFAEFLSRFSRFWQSCIRLSRAFSMTFRLSGEKEGRCKILVCNAWTEGSLELIIAASTDN